MLNELLKKIRTEKNYSLETLGKKLGVTFGLVHQLEKGITKTPEKVLDAYIKEFPEYKRELVLGYLKEKIPQRYWEILK